MVCLACLGIQGGKAGGKARTQAKVEAARLNLKKALRARKLAARQKAVSPPRPQSAGQSTIWTLEDCRSYFLGHPGHEVTAADLIAAAPAKKRASAQRYAGQRLYDLWRRAEIRRVARGCYRREKT
jgi:hypothetical protein